MNVVKWGLCACIAIQLNAADALQRIGGSLGGTSSRGLTYEPAPMSQDMLMNPLRKRDGKLIDLRRKYQHQEAYRRLSVAADAASEPNKTILLNRRDRMTKPLIEWDLKYGSVLSIADEGILIDFRDDIFFLVNYPKQVISDQRIEVYAVEFGTYKYNTVGGSSRTVRSFDYGQLPTPEELAEIQRKGMEIAKAKAMAATKARDAKKAAADKRAVEFLKKRVAQGSASAAYKLGVRYLEGDGVETNKAEAVRLLTLAANEGDKKAQEKLKEQGIEQ